MSILQCLIQVDKNNIDRPSTKVDKNSTDQTSKKPAEASNDTDKSERNVNSVKGAAEVLCFLRYYLFLFLVVIT